MSVPLDLRMPILVCLNNLFLAFPRVSWLFRDFTQGYDTLWSWIARCTGEYGHVPRKVFTSEGVGLDCEQLLKNGEIWCVPWGKLILGENSLWFELHGAITVRCHCCMMLYITINCKISPGKKGWFGLKRAVSIEYMKEWSLPTGPGFWTAFL